MSFISNLLESNREKQNARKAQKVEQELQEKIKHTEVNIETYPELDVLIERYNMSPEDVASNAARVIVKDNEYIRDIKEQIGAAANNDYTFNVRYATNLHASVEQAMEHSPSATSRMTAAINKVGTNDALDYDTYITEIVNNPYEKQMSEFIEKNMTDIEISNIVEGLQKLDPTKSDQLAMDIILNPNTPSYKTTLILSESNDNFKTELIENFGGTYSELSDVKLSELIGTLTSPKIINEFDVAIAASQSIDIYKINNPKNFETKNRDVINRIDTLMDNYPETSTLTERVSKYVTENRNKHILVNSSIKSSNPELKLGMLELYMYGDADIEKVDVENAMQSLSETTGPSHNAYVKLENKATTFNNRLHDIINEQTENVELSFDGLENENQITQ